MDGREQDYQWAGPYMVSRQIIAVNAKSDIYAMDDLNGKTIAVQSTGKPEEIFLQSGQADIPQFEDIIILEDRGILVSRQGQGRFLRSLPTSVPGSTEHLVSGDLTRYSLIELYEVRQALEMKAVALAAQKATEKQMEELTDLYREVCANLFRLGTTRCSQEEKLHLKYLELADNQYLTKVLSHQLENLDLMFEKLQHLIYLHRIEDYVRDHGNIIRAIANHDPEEAQREMCHHIQTTIDILKTGE